MMAHANLPPQALLTSCKPPARSGPRDVKALGRQACMQPIAQIIFGRHCSARTSRLHLQLGEELLEEFSRASTRSTAHVGDHRQLAITRLHSNCIMALLSLDLTPTRHSKKQASCKGGCGLWGFCGFPTLATVS